MGVQGSASARFAPHANSNRSKTGRCSRPSRSAAASRITAPAAPDFWYDTNLERDLDSLLGDIEQTLASAHALTGVTQARNDYGFIGTGQTVAVIDSGIAWDHPNLGNGFGANYRVVGGWDFTEENDANPYDDGPAGSHGTHVAGIVGATANSAGDVGVAPGVDLVGLRVFNDQGDGYFSWVEKRSALGAHESQRVRQSDHGGQSLAGHGVECRDRAELGDARRRVCPTQGGRHLHRRLGGQQLLDVQHGGAELPGRQPERRARDVGRRHGFAELLQPAALAGDRRAGPVDSQHGAGLRRQPERRDRRLGELQRHEHGVAVRRGGERAGARGDAVRRHTRTSRKTRSTTT